MEKKINIKVNKIGSPVASHDVKLKGSGRIAVNLEKPSSEKIKKITNDPQEYKKSIHISSQADEVKKSEPKKEEKKKEEEKIRISEKPLVDIAAPEIKPEKVKNVKKIKKRKEKSSAPKTKTPFKESGFYKGITFYERPKIFKGLCFALVMVSLFLIVASIFVFRPNLTNDGIPSIVTVKYEFAKSTRNLSGSYVFPKGSEHVYVNLTEIASYLDLMVIGDNEEIMFYKKDGSFMSVKKNEYSVNINGVELLLSTPVVFNGKSVFVPAELFKNYTSGLSVDYNIYRERLTLTFVKDEEKSTSINTVYREFEFLPRLPLPIDPIPEPAN